MAVGDITKIEKFTFEGASITSRMRTTRINALYYGMVYYSPPGYVKIRSIKITDVGAISSPDNKLTDDIAGSSTDIVKVDDGMVAIIHGLNIVRPRMKSWGISTVGIIDVAETDDWEFSETGEKYMCIIPTENNIFASAGWFGIDSIYHGWLFTNSIADDGTITKSMIDKEQVRSPGDGG